MSTRTWRPRLGIDEHDLADVGQRLLGGVADLADDDVLAHAQLAQAAGPVARAAEVADDHDERALAHVAAGAGERVAEAVGRRRQRVFVTRRDLAHLQQHADEADPALARRHVERVRVAEREQPEAVAAAARDVTDGEHDALGDVRLAAQRRAEAHRGRGIEDEPGGERALGDVQPHVRLVHARGRVPVDQAHVVARLIGTHLRELHRDAERGRAVIAREQALDAPAHRHVERAQADSGTGPGPGRAAVGGASARATSLTPPRVTSSTRGIGTRSSTGPMMASALTPSASAR